MASHFGTAIGQVVQPPQPEVAGLPVSLGPRPTLLAGREELLSDLDARLSGGDGLWPRMVALYGLGGAGKTSVAVEYAHRHLAEAGLAWQFPAEDPELLLAEFARLAAQLGAREVVDARDPVASVHAVLARRDDWLLVFDNVPGPGSVAGLMPPAGGGRVVVTSQFGSWPGRQVLEVPRLDRAVAAGFVLDRIRTTGAVEEAAALELGGPAAGAGAGGCVHAGGGPDCRGVPGVVPDAAG